MVPLFLSLLLSQAPDPRVEARRLFTEGEARFQARDWAGADASFRASFELKPSASTAWNLAQVAEAAGQPATALGWYRRYLRFDGARDRAQAETAISALEKKLAARKVQALTVFFGPARAIAVLDGTRTLRDGETIEVTPGSHALSVSAAGFVSSQVEVSVDARVSQVVTIRLNDVPAPVDEHGLAQLPASLVPRADEAPPPPVEVVQQRPLPAVEAAALVGKAEPPAHRFRLTWVGVGVTAASLLAAVVAGSAAVSTSNELRDGTVRSGAAATGLKNTVEGAGTAATVSWIVAGVGAVGTGVALGVEW